MYTQARNQSLQSSDHFRLWFHCKVFNGATCMTPMANKKSFPLLGQVLQSISQRNQKTRHTRSCEKIPQFGAVTNNTSSVMINYQAGNTICLYVRPAGGDHKTKFRNNSSSFKNKNAVIPEMIKKKIYSENINYLLMCG